MLPLAMARSSIDGVAIRYKFPVLHMTSCFHTMGPIDRQMGMAQVAVGGPTAVFCPVYQNVAPGAGVSEVSVSDCCDIMGPR